MMNTYEEIIRDHDGDLYDLVIRDFHLVPLFSRDAENIKRWSYGDVNDHAERHNSVWASFYRELSNVSQYDDVMKILNSKNASFNKVPIERLKEFIEAFPTILWLLSLQTNRSFPNAFRMLQAANKLDWLDESLRKLTNKDAYVDAMIKVWPRKFTKPIILMLTSPEMVNKLYNQMSDNMGNRQFGFNKVRETLKEGELGYAYYAAGVESGPVIPISNWINYMILPINVIPENLVMYILQKNTGYVVNLSTTDATNILPGLVARNYTIAVDFLLENYKVDFLIGSYPIPNVVVAQILVKHDTWSTTTWWRQNITTMNLTVLDYFLGQDAFNHVNDNKHRIFESLYTILLNERNTEPLLRILGKYTKEILLYRNVFSHLYDNISRLNSPREEKLHILISSGIFITTPDHPTQRINKRERFELSIPLCDSCIFE